MSQVLLGVRNLSLRIAVIALTAVLLVWFFGGNLFPRTTTIASAFHRVGTTEIRLVHELTPDAEEKGVDASVFVERRTAGGSWQRCGEFAAQDETTALIDVTSDSRVRVWFAARARGTSAWTIASMSSDDANPVVASTVMDRLEAERQLARVAAGLAVQTEDESRAAREAVLHAPSSR